MGGDAYLSSALDIAVSNQRLYLQRMQMKNSPKRVEDILPLTAPVFHILVSLAHTERHGYGIMLDVTAQTDGSLRLGPGTLYGCLKRMLASGLVKEVDLRIDPDIDDERRRYYAITQFGSKVLRAEAQRLQRAVKEARSRALLPGARIGSSS